MSSGGGAHSSTDVQAAAPPDIIKTVLVSEGWMVVVAVVVGEPLMGVILRVLLMLGLVVWLVWDVKVVEWVVVVMLVGVDETVIGR